MAKEISKANETNYWLNLLHDNGYISDIQFVSISTDMKRILNKIIAIVKSTKFNMENCNAKPKT